MRRREVLKCLFDIVEACEAITEFIAGKSHDDYIASRMLRSAVERQLMIVGEALRQALALDPNLTGDIRNTRRIVSFRNRLVHGYSLTDHDIVWGVLETGLPTLQREVTAILEDCGREPSSA
jgi:uncharacterized protein with HEPN domain